MTWILWFVTTRRVKLQPGELAGMSFLGDLIGIETNAWRRPADANALTIVPSRYNPAKSALFTDQALGRLNFICEYLLKDSLVPPTLNPLNVTSFLSFYHAHLRGNTTYKKICTGTM